MDKSFKASQSMHCSGQAGEVPENMKGFLCCLKAVERL
ncbi:hypothetical protein SAMN05878391_0414 [Salinicoccus kekensis]|uniref:Uncharacterized protein n=1 Tax=Salinicoccus kekensis TaxID=714307 RepID=A0A285U9D0_9STAP|nr:hypothetical protein SAMN05878391_0414 [Salinicoccus kekensis]